MFWLLARITMPGRFHYLGLPGPVVLCVKLAETLWGVHQPAQYDFMGPQQLRYLAVAQTMLIGTDGSAEHGALTRALEASLTVKSPCVLDS